MINNIMQENEIQIDDDYIESILNQKFPNHTTIVASVTSVTDLPGDCECPSFSADAC